MTAQSGLARQRLSTELRKLRTEAKRTTADLAQAAGMSQSKLSKIETGMLLPSVADVQRLLAALSAPALISAELIALTRGLRAQSETRRVVLHRGLDRSQHVATLIETGARTTRLFQHLGVPPLLQSEGYLRAALGACSTRDQDTAVRALLARRNRLDNPNKQFLVVLTEAGLRWRVGPAEVMCEQIDHLVRMAHRPNVRFGVIPEHAVTGVADPQSFELYDDTAVMVTVLVGNATITDPQDILEYAELFRRLEQHAVRGDVLTELLIGLSRAHRAQG